LQPVKDGNDVPALRSFQLNLQSHISALETLGVPTSSFGGLLGSRLIKLTPSRLQLEWAKSATNKTTDIEMVIKFIGEQIDAAERYNRIKGVEKEKSSPAPKQPKPANPPPATASQLAVGAKASPAPQVKSSLKTKNVKFNPSWIVCERPCIFCSEIHWPTKCPKGLAERKKIIFDLKRCVNCFGSKHELKDCTSGTATSAEEDTTPLSATKQTSESPTQQRQQASWPAVRLQQQQPVQAPLDN
jgi:hypothetical protein